MSNKTAGPGLLVFHLPQDGRYGSPGHLYPHLWRNFHGDDIVEIGRIITGLHPGRTDNLQKILFSPVGLGLHDLINAKRVYDIAREKGVGTTLKLWDEPIWF